jgi:hypothetical protein
MKSSFLKYWQNNMIRDRVRFLVWSSCVLAMFLLQGHDARAQKPEKSKICVDVRTGSAQQYDCLNQELQQNVPPRAPSAADLTTPNAGSPAPAVGTFNQSATQERLGNNFGKSAFPQRPAPPTFPTPLSPHH